MKGERSEGARASAVAVAVRKGLESYRERTA
jgi:hypothetical protein